MNALRALSSLFLLLPSCATTSGRDWLEAPIEPRAPSAQTSADLVLPEASGGGRPRLRETVTLGESYVAAPQLSAPVAGPAVQVNVTNNIPVVINNPIGYGYGYGYTSGYNYGYARGYSVGAPVRANPSAPQKVGGDFPAPPDYGPRALR